MMEHELDFKTIWLTGMIFGVGFQIASILTQATMAGLKGMFRDAGPEPEAKTIKGEK